ncbi:DUF3795 domain-containing protein [Candidatus Bathyarchaeota archaeon]|nr:DUF3795 domain-containing protein [Candidatus Bathyarchaeota archaeon]
MKVGVCGIACEICPRMKSGICPNGERGCTPKENRFCAVSTCAFKKGVNYCFECIDFPCGITKKGPIAYDYCKYISGKIN